jgi:hypothetical protein
MSAAAAANVVVVADPERAQSLALVVESDAATGVRVVRGVAHGGSGADGVAVRQAKLATAVELELGSAALSCAIVRRPFVRHHAVV